MSRYAAGFLTATMIWLSAGAGAWFMWFRPAEVLVAASAAEPEAALSTQAEKAPRSRRRRRRGGSRRSKGRNAPQNLDRVETRGDELGGAAPRSLDLAGSDGEAQLSGAQIEAGMDGAMGSIRRCLVLAAGDEPVRGRLVFGLRVDPSGRVTRVNLRGPRSVSAGECGACLERAARRAHFPPFDGQDMVIHYPLTLE